MKKVVWLILTNTVKAKIYEVVNRTYTLVNILKYPEGRLRSKELISDKPGHYKTSHAAHGIYIPPSDAHEETHKKFAKDIADYLESQYHTNQYDSLILCAEPHFQGLLNQAMSHHVQSCIIKIIHKDYIPLPESEITIIIEEVITKATLSTENLD